MKKLIIVLFLLLSNFVYSQWVQLNYPDQGTGTNQFASPYDVKVYGNIGNITCLSGKCRVSTDGGLNWTINEGSRNTSYLISNINNKLWMGSDTMPQKSTNGGINFFYSGAGLQTNVLRPLVVGNATRLFTCQPSAFPPPPFYYSTNDGINWISLDTVNTIMGGIGTYDGMYCEDSTILIFTSNFIIKSSNNGRTWRNLILNGLSHYSSHAPAKAGNKLFAVIFVNSESKMYFSTDLGESWNLRNSGLSTSNNISKSCSDGNYAFYFSQIPYAIYFINTNDTLWRSVDMSGLPFFSNFYISSPYIYATLFQSSHYKLYRRPYIEITSSNSNSEIYKDQYELSQNYPNPFNPLTSITYVLPARTFASLKVYDEQGKEVIQLISEEQNEGTHRVNFDGSNFPSGIYFYQLITNSFQETKKMILLK